MIEHKLNISAKRISEELWRPKHHKTALQVCRSNSCILCLCPSGAPALGNASSSWHRQATASCDWLGGVDSFYGIMGDSVQSEMLFAACQNSGIN